MEKVKIELTIGDKKYPFNESPEMARKLTDAAEALNDAIKSRQKKYPGKPINEILSVVALKLSMKNLAFEEYIRSAGHQEQLLEKELESYLENIEKISR